MKYSHKILNELKERKVIKAENNSRVKFLENSLRKITFKWLSFVEVKLKKGMLKKEKKIFCKQFVRIKKILTTEPRKHGLKFSVSVKQRH